MKLTLSERTDESDRADIEGFQKHQSGGCGATGEPDSRLRPSGDGCTQALRFIPRLVPLLLNRSPSRRGREREKDTIPKVASRQRNENEGIKNGYIGCGTRHR